MVSEVRFPNSAFHCGFTRISRGREAISDRNYKIARIHVQSYCNATRKLTVKRAVKLSWKLKSCLLSYSLRI